MFRQQAKMKKFLAGNRAPRKGPSPAIDPGTGTDAAAGEENVYAGGGDMGPTTGENPVSSGGSSREAKAAAFAAHHQKLADHFRAQAGGVPHPADEAESRSEAMGETPLDEEMEGPIKSMGAAKPIEGSPEEEAGESPAFEAKEDEETRRKRGGSLKNSKSSGKPLSRFAAMAAKGRY